MTVKTINGSSNSLKSTFQNLQSSTPYKTNVEAVVIIDQFDEVTNQTQKVTHNSPPASLGCHTSPRSPISLRLVKVGYTDVSITWSPPPNTRMGKTIKEYLVRYVTMDATGSKVMAGTEKILSALKNTNINVTGLAMGFMFGFSVQV